MVPRCARRCSRHARVLDRLAWPLVALAAALPFTPTLNAYFLADDFGLIYAFAGRSPAAVLSMFASPWIQLYGVVPDELRPVLAFSYVVDAMWGAAWPPGYHATNIVLHVLNTWLVYAIARRIARLGSVAATLTAVLFAVLPVHAETVGWISGRADSLPALFYLSAFLGYGAWRRGAGPYAYVLAVGATFLALWTKQSAITLVATLVFYDTLVERRVPWSRWPALLPYAPFALLTGAYLGLRLALFGNAVREHQIGVEKLREFALHQRGHLQALLMGRYPGQELPALDVAVVAGLAVLLLVVVVVALTQPATSTRLRALLFFGPAWWLTTVAPLAVAYPTPRHLYLTAAGAVMLAGVAIECAWRRRTALARTAAVAGASALIVMHTLTLRSILQDWNAAAAISQQMLNEIEQTAMTLPPGSLLVLGAEDRRRLPHGETWLWSWASPFMLRPPFVATDLTRRVVIVEPEVLYCCWGELWAEHVREDIRTWAARPERFPAVVLVWDSWDGHLYQLSTHEDPALRPALARLAETTTVDDLNAEYRRILERAVDRNLR